jgi:hypothetical protein
MSGLNHAASVPAAYASNSALPHRLQGSLPAGGYPLPGGSRTLWTPSKGFHPLHRIFSSPRLCLALPQKSHTRRREDVRAWWAEHLTAQRRSGQTQVACQERMAFSPIQTDLFEAVGERRRRRRRSLICRRRRSMRDSSPRAGRPQLRDPYQGGASHHPGSSKDHIHAGQCRPVCAFSIPGRFRRPLCQIQARRPLCAEATIISRSQRLSASRSHRRCQTIDTRKPGIASGSG